jgi:Kef-type K+ transport system membrane component KefB
MNFDTGILLIFGICVSGGIFSAVVMKRLSIPQVLGYIIAGIIIGESGFHLVTIEVIQKLRSFNYFALGIIGFLVGSEIKFTTLKKYGKQFSAILLAEGVLAFILVGTSVSVLMWYITNSLSISLATGIVFGAISSATDPASTIDVLWEYRTAGILTTTIIAIVALDDALAMTLYGLGTSVAQILSGTSISIARILSQIGIELIGSILLGIFSGYILNLILHRFVHKEQMLASAISLLLLNIWLSVVLNMDIILLTMAMGITVVNTAPKRSEYIINLIKNFSTPLYVLFFVLVGARLSIKSMPAWLWAIVLFYVFFRSFGKMLGAYLGAKISGSTPVVQKYIGFGLFAQGGVAIGLSIMATQHLHNIEIKGGLYLSDVIIFGITTTTFIVQVIGPSMVKFAVKKAGEIGKNVTEQDIMKKWHVRDLISNKIIPVPENTLLKDLFLIFSQSDSSYHPVIDDNNRFIGLITFNELKEILLDRESWNWLVASDLAVPVNDIVLVDDPLENAVKLMNQIGTDQIPVINNKSEQKYEGEIELMHINHMVQQQMLTPES